MLVDAAVQLRADAEREESALRSRDRVIGAGLRAGGESGGAKPQAALGAGRAWVGAWVEAVRGEGASEGQRVEGAVHVGTTLLSVLGVLAGSSATAAVFRFDGGEPVNVLQVLGLLVGLQLVMVVLTVVVMLPASWRAWVPGLRGVQEGLAAMSVGRLLAAAVRLLPQRYREALDRARGLGGVHERLFGQVYRWVTLRAAQHFGVGFNTGVLATAMALIIYTSLAFGWSTTLDVDVAQVYRLTQAVSLPWWWLEQARPSAELIELTRYFRTAGGAGYELGPEFDPRVPGGWWPFLVMSVVVYGLLPRLGLAWWAGRRMRAAVREAVAMLPGMAELEQRVWGHEVVTTPGNGKAGVDGVTGGDSGGAKPQAAGDVAVDAGALGDKGVVIRWAGVDCEGVTGEVVDAGGRELADDQAAIARVAASDDAVVVAVRGWEPPVMDLLDFLGDLRRGAGDGRVIAVWPRGVGEDDAALAVWRQTLGTLGDPWLKVVTRA